MAKRADATLRERIAVARDEWARLRAEQHVATLYESQSARAAGRKALKPQPTRQAKWVVRYLTTRVPLQFAAIPEEEIASACKQCNLSLETWRRQERAFGLMGKVYAKRAPKLNVAVRGAQMLLIGLSQGRAFSFTDQGQPLQPFRICARTSG